MSAVAEFERQRIGERTREALQAARRLGVRLGRPRVLTDEIVDRIRAERELGATLTAIADGLTADDVPTGHGGRRWYHSTVAAALRSD